MNKRKQPQQAPRYSSDAAILRRQRPKKFSSIKALFFSRGYYDEYQRARQSGPHDVGPWVRIIARKQFAQLMEPDEREPWLKAYVRFLPDFAAGEQWVKEHLEMFQAAGPKSTGDSHPPKKLPAKKHDYSRFFDEANLTEKQRRCCSLRLEYELPITQIANRLHIDRATVRQHLALGRQKMDRSTALQRSLKNRARHSPTD